MTDELLNEAQVHAFDRLVDLGGEERWVSMDEVGHHQTVRALERRRVIQTRDVGGQMFCALAGILLEEVDERATEEAAGAGCGGGGEAVPDEEEVNASD